MAMTAKRPTARQRTRPTGQMRVRVRQISIEEGRKLLDRDAKANLNVSAETFMDLYKRGILNEEHPTVSRLGMIASVIDPE